MTEQERDPYVEWIARELRRPVGLDGGGRERIMAAVRAEPVPVRVRRPWQRLSGTRVALSPLAALAAAAAFVAVGLGIGRLAFDRDVPRDGSPVAVVENPRLPVSDTGVVKFVLVAPHARQVAVVGDFNAWDNTATPMVRSETGGTWTATLRLGPGRHMYAFVVDGEQWLADPAAPLAPDDGLGAPSSVMLIGGPST